MPKDIIEILTFIGSRHALQRMKLDAIINFKKADFDFCRFGEGGDRTACVLINGLDVDFGKYPLLYEKLKSRAGTALIMMFIADLYPAPLKLMPAWSEIVDIFLVPTPEMKNFLSAFTECQIEVHVDPVDFSLSDSVRRPRSDSLLKLAWFGYPESYQKSMGRYEKTLHALHEGNEIEYHIVTKNNKYGRMGNCVIHEYVPDSFLALLNTFDVCIMSHAPFDFFINTFWKSENKAVLAINRGLPCVATRTPAYERLFTLCGLQDYLYSSTAELVSSITRLKSWAERDRYLEKSQKIVLENYSADKMADHWLKLYHEARARKRLGSNEIRL